MQGFKSPNQAQRFLSGECETCAKTLEASDQSPPD